MNMMRMEFTYRRHVKAAVLKALITSVMWGLHLQAHSRNMPVDADLSVYEQEIRDTLITDTVASDSSLVSPVRLKQERNANRTIKQLHPSHDTLFVADLKKSSFISLQQYLKGNIAGLYVQENNGEPGTIQHMLLRGISSPIFSNRDLAATQPTVYVNGMPLTQRHPYVYDIKQHDVNPLGSANNMLAGLDLNNILSVEVIKDPARLAQLGPFASNGAIWIQTKDAVTSRKNEERVTLNASYGVVTPPQTIRPTNAIYERAFRKQFYDAYNLPFGTEQLPAYLQDRSDANYSGSTNWANAFYNLGQQYDAYASLRGGGENASLLFTAGSTKNSGIADSTQYMKNNLNFFIS